MRHIGQYVDSGAVLLGSTGDDALAFQNPNGSFVVAISNTGNAKDMTVSVGGKSYKFAHPGKGWATLYVGPKPVSTTNDLAKNQMVSKTVGLTVATMTDGYKITLSSQAAGRIELLTPAGRMLASREIAQGSREVMLPRQSTTGLLIVRAIIGSEVTTAQLVAY